jgi:signal transduction histidine kinase
MNDGVPRPNANAGAGAPRESLVSLRRWWSATIDRFVPAQIQADPDQTRRARLLIAYSLLSVFPGTIFFALSVFNYRRPMVTWVSGVTALLNVLMPLVLRRTGSLALATSGLLTVLVGSMLLVSASAQDQALITLPWLAVVPLMATALAGRAAGIGWAIVCIALGEAHLLLAESGAIPGEPISAAAFRVASAWNVALLILVVLLFVILSESLRLRTTAALAEAQARLEAARENALRAERLASLGQMAAGVAHEINNPIAFVSSNLALLREDLARGPLEPALQREYVEDILPATEEGIDRVIGIVADLRRFARGEEAEGAEFDFNAEVRAALRICEKALGDRRLVVQLGNLPKVMGRAREVAQVTVNLTMNAAYATTRGGEIRVETWSTGDEVVLRVSDDGTGMTPEVKERLFEPFFTTKPVGEGTGLGLAVVHGIVRAHGGSIQVDSALGSGSTFDVRIPVRKPSAPG